MNSYQEIEQKLLKLIDICKRTRNYKKLAVVGFILISNRANEIGLKLGLRPRKKNDGESIFDYLKQMNKFLYKIFQINLFSEEFLLDLKKNELLFTKAHGEIPFVYLSDIFKLFYDLRKIQIPDMYKEISYENFSGSVSELSLFSSFLSSSNSIKNEKSNLVKNLMLHQLREEEKNIKSKLKNNFDPDSFQKAIILKKVKASMQNNGTGKIKIQGTLKDNIIYERSVNQIIGHFLLGIFILLLGLGIILLFEILLFPMVISYLSSFILLFFGSATFFFYIYWSQFMK